MEKYSSPNYCNHVENHYTSDYENQILYKKPFVLPCKDDIFKNNNINNKLKKKEKIKKNIEVNIETLGDLIDIANNNAFEYNVEYNIDLKVLHNIKDDLIKLNSMIGLTEFKKSILSQLLYFIQNLHISKESDFMHTVIYGPPGTGKTEIANILGSIYSNIGVLKNNKFKAVSRSDLIAGYLGQTALKTSKVIEECLGGCLFIDEAYSLANGKDGDSYSRECIDTLCESLSKYKSDLMVIIAGYKDELQETFFKANRGLESRFIWRFHLEEYDHEELLAILKKKIQENEWNLKIDNHELNKWFKMNYKTFKYFGRDVELLFSYIKMAHGRRLYGKSSDLRKCINMEDLENGFQQFNEHSKIKTKEKILGMYV
tara:strand:+ start:22 stop:1137 length:1116 start_codon:yes stop_codon:yes gene_type:complete